MARGKKNEKILTPEEKLKEVLVPNSEWPYKVPENWRWVRLRSIASHISDGSHNPPKDSGKGVPLLSATNIDQTSRWVTEAEWMAENERTRIELGDILLTIVATIGRVAVVTTDQPFALQRSVATIKPKIDEQYLSYYLESPYIQMFMNTNAKGTAQKGFYLKSLENLLCAVPPLPEQQRIVDRIESLFAKLDEAKEKAQAVVDGFEDRKAAILHKAFTGELTEEWRKENNVGKDTWKTVSIESVCDVFSGKGFKEKEYSTHGVKLLRISNVTYDSLIWDDTKYLPNNYIITEADLVLKLGDIVMALNRPITNNKLKVSLVDDGTYILYQRVGCLRIKRAEELIPQYLQYCLLSKKFLHQVESHLQGSDQPYINLPPLKKLTIELCSTEEQMAIIKVINSIIRNETRAKESAEQVIAQIDIIKKSILARAFRGKLGTNDPSDESAEELLKQII